jgi:hypothetical protein
MSGRSNYLKRGSWNVICMRCGDKLKADMAQLEWDNLWVCKECFEERQPQDFTRGYIDKQIPPYLSPEPPDNFVD